MSTTLKAQFRLHPISNLISMPQICTQLNSSPATDKHFQFFFNLCFIVFVMSLTLANHYPTLHNP